MADFFIFIIFVNFQCDNYNFHNECELDII